MHINKPKRLSWDEFFLMLTIFCSTRGTCDRLRTGSLIVKKNKIVSTGYNGSVSGGDHCDEVGHLLIGGHCLMTLHGEENAILNTTNKEELEGASIYCVGRPCFRCFKQIAQVGIKKIFFISDYDNKDMQVQSEIDRISKMKDIQWIKVDFDFEKILAKAMDVLRGPGGFLRHPGN